MKIGAAAPAPRERPAPLEVVSVWLAGSRLGLAVMALLVGAGAGLGAAAFRWLIFTFTWVVTGHQQFGQQGHAPSLHLPSLGIWFVVVVPILGGLLYGPLINRFAREARGHGVPEVMLAVAENGGRIRPPVTIVKALASAICIAVGGSVGREGPIVQIGSAFASTCGQLVRMSERQLRIIVACGAAGGIAATFNAPITGLFFGFEIVLREFSLDALFTTSLAAVTGDLISRAFFGSAPFFTGIPHDLVVVNDSTYLLIALLAIAAGLIGVGFKTFLYRLEDLGDQVWKGRPEWARPAVGGLALGLLLLALPQMYGVGYPVMDKVVAGHVVLWLVLLFMLGKILAASLTLSIGGSGGVFAPSLFVGAMAGTTYGVAAHDIFGASVGPTAIYSVVGMAGVFGAAAQAPLTSIASVLEMTGNFTLTVPVMLATGISAAISKRISYGSIYTTKLLRRGIDIERPKPGGELQGLRVADVMQPVSSAAEGFRLLGSDTLAPSTSEHEEDWERLIGRVADGEQPQAVFADEGLEQALRQLVLYGRDGLPVVSHDGRELRGWITRQDVLGALAARLTETADAIERGAVAADVGYSDPEAQAHVPPTPLAGYRIVEFTVSEDAPAVGRRIEELELPAGMLPVAVTEGREIVAARNNKRLDAGDRLIILAPGSGDGKQDATAVSEGTA